jgi:hypothetical protein
VTVVFVGSLALYFLVDVPCEAWRGALVKRMLGRRRSVSELESDTAET